MARRLAPFATTYPSPPRNDALPEHAQDAAFANPLHAFPANPFGPRRRVPVERPYIEHIPGDGWWRGGRKKRGFQPRYYFTRPRDGKRSGFGGRLKDALTGEGADVFVTACGDKRTLMRDRPQRAHWSGWGRTAEEEVDRWFDKDARVCEDVWPGEVFGGDARAAKPVYNFRSRKFENPSVGKVMAGKVWRDAEWRPGARRGDQMSESWRDPFGYWHTDLPWGYMGGWPGGRPQGEPWG